MQIQISWLLQKPTDLDLHCLLRLGMMWLAKEGLIKNAYWEGYKVTSCEQWSLWSDCRCTDWFESAGGKCQVICFLTFRLKWRTVKVPPQYSVLHLECTFVFYNESMLCLSYEYLIIYNFWLLENFIYGRNMETLSCQSNEITSNRNKKHNFCRS